MKLIQSLSPKKWLCALALGLFATPALAQVDVNCLGSNCLVRGWESFNLQTLALDQSFCFSLDCSQFGWREFRGDGRIYEYRCLPGGCFEEGYQIVELFEGGNVIAEVQCLGQDCHGIGSLLKSEGHVDITLCKDQDCRSNGWSTRWRNQITSDVSCKVGGCFVNGWLEK